MPVHGHSLLFILFTQSYSSFQAASMPVIGNRLSPASNPRSHLRHTPIGLIGRPGDKCVNILVNWRKSSWECRVMSRNTLSVLERMSADMLSYLAWFRSIDLPCFKFGFGAALVILFTFNSGDFALSSQNLGGDKEDISIIGFNYKSGHQMVGLAILSNVKIGMYEEFKIQYNKLIKETPNPKFPYTVFLDSAGGNIVESLKIANFIRKRKMFTFAFGKKCLSSCIFLFMGGEKRFALPSTKMGVHKGKLLNHNEFTSSPVKIEKLLDEWKYRLFSFSNKMGIDERIIVEMFETANDKMKYLSETESAIFRLVTDFADPFHGKSYLK